MYPCPSDHTHCNSKCAEAQGYQLGGVSAVNMNIYPRQPYPSPYVSNGTRWSTELCHCCDDPANCFITCVCPCVTFGQIAEIVNKGSVSCAATGTLYGILALTGLPCLYSCFYRSRLRGQYDLEEAPCADCLVHFCCEPCALCQEYRELKKRGFDMGIGKHGQTESWNYGSPRRRWHDKNLDVTADIESWISVCLAEAFVDVFAKLTKIQA